MVGRVSDVSAKCSNDTLGNERESPAEQRSVSSAQKLPLVRVLSGKATSDEHQR